MRECIPVISVISSISGGRWLADLTLELAVNVELSGRYTLYEPYLETSQGCKGVLFCCFVFFAFIWPPNFGKETDNNSVFTEYYSVK